MRAPARLTLGEAALELLPDGRVLRVLPAVATPFGAVLQSSVLYPSLRACLTATLGRRLAPLAPGLPPSRAP